MFGYISREYIEKGGGIDHIKKVPWKQVWIIKFKNSGWNGQISVFFVWR